MKRKVDTKELQIGMYVSELDRPWLETPFLFQGFTIHSLGDINELAHFCQYVYIDEERSHYTPEEIASTIPIEPLVMENAEPRHSKPAAKIALEEEIGSARELREFAVKQVSLVLSLAHDNQTIDGDEVTQVVSDLTESLVRNPDALLLLASIRSYGEQVEAHAISSCILALSLGRFMKFSQRMVEELGVAALLHDIGKVHLPVELSERGPKTPEEVALMRRHPEFGAEILRDNPGIPHSAVDAAYSHHEQIDGKGYPRGVSGESLTIFAKIVAIINVYDKLTRGKGEHNMSPSEALRYLYLYRDTLFDAKLTEAFIKCLGIYPVGSLVELVSGEVGIVISSPPGEHLHPHLMLVRTTDKRPYDPPRLINLSSFARKQDSADRHSIRQVLPPNAYGVDMRAYLLSESVL